MPLHLDYFYGGEAEQYTFYRIPKALFTDDHYKSVSVEAKVLYGLLLDRMALSVRNGWLDERRRVFIYFTLEDAITQMGCGKDKAVKLFKELDATTGIGLIERRKQGQGKPTRIYVKNFVLPLDTEPPTVFQTSENQKSEPEVVPETSEKPKSGLLEIRSQDFGKPATNKTEKNKTEISDTESSFASSRTSLFPRAAPLPGSTAPSLLLPPQSPAGFVGTPPARAEPERHKPMRMDEMEAYRAVIRENIEYDFLLDESPQSAEIVDGYVELMAEVCCSRREHTRIGGEDVPTVVVRSRLLKLTREHIEYVMESLARNATLVKNIRAYTLTALYNAPTTIAQYYTSLVSHDMAAGDG